MIGSLVVLALTQVPAQKCLSEYGQTKCGYACTAGSGQVKCAASPLGACAAAYGKVVCWDPSPDVVQAHARRTGPASCLAQYGKIACGWSCAAGAGDVKCAATPLGACLADNGKVVCSDPPAPLRGPRYRDVPPQQCASGYGKTACGWGCVADYGQVKCSQKPGGVCQAASGKITCSE